MIYIQIPKTATNFNSLFTDLSTLKHFDRGQNGHFLLLYKNTLSCAKNLYYKQWDTIICLWQKVVYSSNNKSWNNTYTFYDGEFDISSSFSVVWPCFASWHVDWYYSQKTHHDTMIFQKLETWTLKWTEDNEISISGLFQPDKQFRFGQITLDSLIYILGMFIDFWFFPGGMLLF